jgi:hypothetical protein
MLFFQLPQFAVMSVPELADICASLELLTDPLGAANGVTECNAWLVVCMATRKVLSDAQLHSQVRSCTASASAVFWAHHRLPLRRRGTPRLDLLLQLGARGEF